MDKSKELYPLGMGHRVDHRTNLVPVKEVANKVLWVNPHFRTKLPMNLEEKKPTKLGVFVTNNPDETSMRLLAYPGHRRSLQLGQIILEDDGNPSQKYRDIDLKGIGHIIEKGKKFLAVKIRRRGDGGSSGILERTWAEHDRDMTEKFIEAGLRTYRYLAIIHKKKYSHTFLTEHNITLDCRIVDLDSVAEEKNAVDLEDLGKVPELVKQDDIPIGSVNGYLRDLVRAFYSFEKLLKILKLADKKDQFLKEYLDAYRESFQARN